MNRRVWLNLALLVTVLVLALLALLAYFEPGTSETSPASPLSTLAADSAAQIRFQVRGQDEVAMQRRGAQWWLTQPVVVPASDFQIARLFELINAESAQRYDAASLSLAQYGLVPPEVTLVVDDEQFAFGGLSPMNYQRYVLLGGVLHLVDVSDLSVFTRGWNDLVDLQLLPKDARPVRITLASLGTLVATERGWRRDGDTEVESNDDLVALVERWRHAQAFKVSPWAMDADESEAVVVQLLKVAEPVVFYLSRQGSEWLLGRKDLGIQYHLDAAQAQRLFSINNE